MSRFAENFLSPDQPPMTRAGYAVVKFSVRGWIAVGAVLLLVMLPSLLLPLGPDQALFFVSGQKILQGAVHYRDIVDVKPPLIYHMYALAITLFTGHAIAIRIFDLLLQALTCRVMIGLVRRVSSNDLIAALAALCYLLLYYAQDFASQAQPESFVGLGGLLIARMILFGESRRRFPGIGAICGALFLFKFTFGMMLPIAILAGWMLRAGSLRNTVKDAVMMIGGFIAVASLLPIYLTAFGAWHDFMLVNRFISGYSRISLASPAQWFRNLLEHPALHLCDHYSIVFLLALAVGVGLSLRRPGERDITRESLLRFCVIAFVLLFGTIVIEGKYAFYHFDRLYPFGAILTAFGLAAIPRLFRNHGAERVRGPVMFAIAIPALLLFTPIPRYAVNCAGIAWQMWRYDGFPENMAADDYSGGVTGWQARETGLLIRMWIEQGHTGKVFVASSTAGTIYQQAGVVPEFNINHFAFVTAPFAPREWKDSTRAYILREQPRYIVAETSDRLPDVTGSNASSLETLRALPGVDSLLRARYDSLRSGDTTFIVFKQRGDQ
ncbi:MAG: hypothetical protein JWQ98_2520 [Chlorobi bacterium]|nr:hypothetical protein [Chlorobiota bacterium]